MTDFSLQKPTLPAIEDVQAYGSFVYVEVLSANEMLNTKLTLTGNIPVKVNEAYVLGLGPLVPKEYGIEVGHRVFIDGGITFGPNYKEYRFTDEGRKRGVVQYSAIKGRIIESSPIAS